MFEINYVDRVTGKKEKEKVYGQFFLQLLYGEGWFFSMVSIIFLPIFSKIPFLSKFYGSLQNSSSSRRKVKPFIRKFNVDTSEFLDPVESFRSFNAFFIRKLKAGARPLAQGDDVAILPADGRYLAYPSLHQTDGFWVKEKKFLLKDLLQDEALALRYEEGSMLLVRLCPTDYHRFHFPCDCTPGEPRLINGFLYSVNPLAVKKNISIFSENKRVITELKTEGFGTILYIDVGATYVGSIHQTFTPGKKYLKGDEKGYFSFGGSSLILLFEPNRIVFDQDLIDVSAEKMELRGLFGQSLGKSGIR